MVASETSVGIGLALSGVLASTFFGVPLTDLGSGTLMCGFGVMGRAAFDIQRTLKSGGSIQLSRIAGWTSAGFLGAPTAAITVLVILKSFTDYHPDGVIAFGLLAFGFGGQDIVGPVWNQAKVTLNKWFKLNLEVDPPVEPK